MFKTTCHVHSADSFNFPLYPIGLKEDRLFHYSLMFWKEFKRMYLIILSWSVRTADIHSTYPHKMHLLLSRCTRLQPPYSLRIYIESFFFVFYWVNNNINIPNPMLFLYRSYSQPPWSCWVWRGTLSQHIYKEKDQTDSEFTVLYHLLFKKKILNTT